MEEKSPENEAKSRDGACPSGIHDARAARLFRRAWEDVLRGARLSPLKGLP